MGQGMKTNYVEFTELATENAQVIGQAGIQRKYSRLLP